MKMGEKLLSALPWLKPLLETEFYRLCGCKSLKQCNFYCTECMGSPFCEDCNNDPLKHEGHIYLRVNGEMMDSEEETNSEEEDVDPTSIDDQLTCQPDVQANPNSLRKRNRKGNPNRAPFS
ncbi:hypothetical protein COLO4_28240 [Corchorus olitorius]|uniref:Uncharacterized protein n=1 Tax=Corchorus olitorius TaxID=93759 RepID=A0A1R3HMB1_9ROSI|nr:hypothetical protein COLO4_28240 [Corchorus olitorius]